MNENKEFKPYIPADKITPEFTVTSIIMGVILAVIFGAANAYLGLRVGMTVSASIPAAVISMGVIRKIMKKNSILESNMVQTIGSAGESLAAGAIFTMPALFLWAEEGLCEMPGIVEITLIALCGGVLGVLFMVPLRNALIVKEHATLLYPEGTACADVLLAGEEGGANAATVFSGMGIAAIFKFVVDGLKVIPADVAVAFKGFKGEIGMECYPALLGVGYIVGPRIASFMFVGSLIGWMVLIPVICLFGADTVMYPGTETISALYAAGGASKIWSTYVKYIGAGAIATGGIISLIKSLPLIIATFRDSMKSMKGGKNTSTERTAQDLPMNVILIGIVAMVAIIWLVPAIPVNPIGALIIVIFGFFFATVSSSGMGIAAIFKFVVDGLKVIPADVAVAFKGFKGEIGMECYPALLGVGYIVGPRIASFMFVGSLIGWMVLIPVICLFGADTVMYPGTETISALYAAGGASKIWSTYVKYIGAGAIATGGIISLIKSLPLIIATFRDSMKSMKGGKNTSTERTAQDLPMNVILIGIVAMVAIIWLVPAIPVNPIGALIIVIFGFFFATVSSRMVGLVGSSNNPVSGMAIATLLIATMVIKASGNTGIDGMKAAIAIGSVICIVAAIAGDTSQDLKTGYLLGATPKKQQIGELIGVVAAGLAIGGVLYLLNTAWGYGSAEVPAPQATLMKMIVEGIMGGKLPWTLVFIGVFLAIGLEILRIPVMPFAIGLYLPIYLNAAIMIGGVVRMFVDGRKNVDDKKKEEQATDGTLYCAGMIAGEGLVGILLAILAVVNVSSVFDLSGSINLGNAGGVILMLLMILSLLKFSIWNKKKA